MGDMVRVVRAVVVVSACVVWVTVSVRSLFVEADDDEDEDADLTEVIFVAAEEVAEVDEDD